jgi:Protein of unknown function (DUF2380)
MNAFKGYLIAGLLVVNLCFCHRVSAITRVAILEFELSDITTLPNTPAELARTQSMRPLLVEAMAQIGGYNFVHIPVEAQHQADAGVGYLFRFHDITAQLAKSYVADWVILGRHSKPSFLESSLIVDVIDVSTEKRIAELNVDLKGNHRKVTERAIKRLAVKINQVISSMPGCNFAIRC